VGDAVFPFIFNTEFSKKKIKNHSFKLLTVFTFEILASRSSKLDTVLIDFVKHF
jgi:hypothetical protein